MRALTLTNPWAGLVASGLKLVENRPRKMIKSADFGKQFAIHAGKFVDEPIYDRIREIAPELFSGEDHGPWYRMSRITSAVIAVATIDSIVFDSTGLLANEIDRHLGEQRRWYFGPVGYVLRDVRALATPVPCRGALGFWTLPADVERAVSAQVAL